MNGRIVAGVMLTLIAAAVIVGIGATVYNAGMAQGLAQSGQLIERAPDGAIYPYYGRPFGGFGFFGLIFPLFFMLFIFGAMRALFWRGAWSRGHLHHGAWAGKWDPSKGPQGMFEEWHRQAHEAQPTEK